MRFILLHEFSEPEIIEPPMIAQSATVILRGEEVWTSDPELYDVYERRFARVETLMVWKIRPESKEVQD